ncbi:ATP-binding protein [Hyalangium rubrum]|uniref:histidine kinase n=1 Tax=Hyalangium rubrum TaxID=3103134 RepID=A0ABU5GZQ3_9BACT|nr:ATP-binding protein [Hyalangium sp. s54d21]MDY7226017.1 ATP-binding protein [Hyalangium sp. s54d21]
MRFFRSLQGKILLFFVLIDVATVGVLMVTVSDTAREALGTKIEEQLRLNARITSRDIEEQLDLKWSFMQSLASNTFMVNSVIDVLGRGEYLAPFMQQLQLPGMGGEQADLWLLDFEGAVIARNTVHTSHPEGTPNFAHELWWPSVRDGQPAAVVLEREGRSRLLLAFPVLYQKRTEGAVVAEFDVALLRELTARDGFEAALLSRPGPLFGALSDEVLERVREVGTGPGHRSTFLVEDTFYLVEPLEGFMLEHGLGWSLVLSVPAERIAGPVAELRERMLGTGAAMAALFTVLVVWGTRSLLRPLERIEGTMRHIVEAGDLSQRIRLRSDDELGSIARTFDQMLERLEHRTAELERSRDQLALLAHITSAAPSAIVMLDTQARVCVWNQAAERLFGWSREEIAEGPFLERVVPMGVQTQVAELLSRASTGVPAEAELSLVTRGVGPIPVLLTVTRITDAAGLSLGHVFMVRDQREVKRLRESLVQSEKMAAVGTLVAGLSHELNNPLGIILGYAQGLQRRTTLDENSRAAVGSIERQTQRCAHLVRALLDFSRDKVPVRERVSVLALFERVGELVEGQARRANIHFEVDAPAQGLPELEISVQEIESALLNLVTNALDATPAGGAVRVIARGVLQGQGVELIVTDTGSGMSEEVLQRAFDPFFTTKPVGQGTGLGLSITRNIIEAHAGAIDVKTAPGAGTTVRLWLPAAGAPAQAHPTEATTWK